MAARRDRPEPLPSGTVTLLFGDLEGSTQLLHVLGDAYAELRARVRELVRAAADPRGGHEVDWAGDGAFLAFARARDAVEAAAEIQRALAAEAWPGGAAVRLRIGVHTGEPRLDEHGYVGLPVHVAARICAAAHGGQVVVSRQTRDFVDAASGLAFRPLGSHRLRDVPEPEQLYQLVAPGLATDFPPLRTLGGASLPALHHRLVGRRDDLGAVLAMLGRDDVRLVTITGPGGAGKSRLALEVAGLAALERPVHLVGLAPVSDPELVPTAIAGALGVREAAGRGVLDTVADALAGTGTLLLLDNLEHLSAVARDVGALLDRAPDLDVLVTSRTPLRLSGERIVPLRPLGMDDAATLFTELAAAHGVALPGDAAPAVQEICRRLDGLPLAIELVAARLTVLPPAHLLRALDDGLALEMEGPVDLPARQRTLRATIEWSYGLLTESQRSLHEALAVFAGGCTLDDGRALAGAGASFMADLEALVAGSLLQSEITGADVRLSMLETVREHALARLSAEGRIDDLRRRHAERFLGLALASREELARPHHADWLRRLERELDNVRTALDWLLAAGRVEDALRATTALERFWRAHAHVGEARRWFSFALDLAGDAPAAVRADALRAAAHQAMAQSDWAAADALLREAVRLFGEGALHAEEATALAYLSFVALRREDMDEAADVARRALELARRVGDPGATAFALMAVADAGWAAGEFESVLAQYEEAVELRRGLGDPLLVTDAIYNLGMAAFQGGELARARAAFEEALVLGRELDEAPYVAAAQFMLAHLDVTGGDAEAAAPRAQESLALYAEFGDDRSCARCLVVLAGVAVSRGAPAEAARLVGAAEALRGGEPPDAFETVLLERNAAPIEQALGREQTARLKCEGAALRVDEAREVGCSLVGR